jgi:hypothetical protein
MRKTSGRGSRRHEAAFLGGRALTWRPKYEKGWVSEAVLHAGGRGGRAQNRA